MTINHLFAGIAVTDYDAALSWYERFFGRAPDVIVTEHEAMWHVADAGSIYLVGDAARAGKVLLTLAVPDLEQQVAQLAARGLAIATIEMAPDIPKKAVVIDPEGNRLTLFEDPARDRPDFD